MKIKYSIILWMFLFIQSFTIVMATEIEQKEINMNNKIKVIIGTKVFVATLFENETAKEFKRILPITLNMTDLNKNEKYFHFSKSFPMDKFSPKMINSGDLMLWNDNSLVLFYKTFSTNYQYTKVGKIDNPNMLAQTLGNDDIKITFDLE
ncbi:MAG: hypothetical protein K2P52_01400 [Campylobacterales bacterium]|nr:hypothetical protein [Campylobacterales bacterium]